MRLTISPVSLSQDRNDKSDDCPKMRAMGFEELAETREQRSAKAS